MAVSITEFLVGVDAAIVLQYGSPNQSVIKGLDKMTLPSLTRAVIKISEFRRDFGISKTGEGTYGDISYSGTRVKGDANGQDHLRQCLASNAAFNDARFYLNTDDFLTVDIANDPGAVFQVSDNTPGQIDKASAIPFSGKMTVGGMTAYFFNHLNASTLAFVATGNEITDSGSGFVTAGFAVGMTLIVEGSTANDGQYVIKTVAPGILTLDPTIKSVIDGASGVSVTLHGGTA